MFTEDALSRSLKESVLSSIEGHVHVELTHSTLDAIYIMKKVKSPQAGAVVLFAGTNIYLLFFEFRLTVAAGTTRDNFAGKPVKGLQYSAYEPLALRTMLGIAKSVKKKHSLTSVSMIHRLGAVPIGEESILIAVSSPHRQAAWRGGEELLEECKANVEIWKLEEFGGDEEGVWRANRDGGVGVQVEKTDSSRS
ncbi:Molybdopterin synthase catalytic subunit [Lambiella insularis]|nr:Molybdopterin synthase catalytic subunit [Lambiella insularis]